jgi:hypothetical protein
MIVANLRVMCRFRMRQRLFLHIVKKVHASNPYFRQKQNCVGDAGFKGIHKCTVAMKMLANRCSADTLDGHFKMDESTSLETMKKFVETIIDVAGDHLKMGESIALWTSEAFPIFCQEQ